MRQHRLALKAVMILVSRFLAFYWPLQAQGFKVSCLFLAFCSKCKASQAQGFKVFGLSLAFRSSRFQGSWPFSWPLQAQVFSLFLAFSSSRFQNFWPFLGSCRLKASRFLASLVAFASSRFQGFCPSLGLWKLKVSRLLAFSWPLEA